MSAGLDVNIKIRQLIHEGLVDSVVVGEAVDAKVVVVTHPAVLSSMPDTPLEVLSNRCIIVVNQAPRARFLNGHTLCGRTVYEVDTVIKNARSAFGMDPILAPISPVIRRVLMGATDYRDFTKLDWMPLTNWIPPPRRDSNWDSRRLPILGRHGRDHEDKWPSDPTRLRAAYCADKPIEVRILGGAEHAARLLGGVPSNWTVMPFDSIDVPSFLGGLDFFAHYPHEHCIEAFGYCVLEAIAMGVPAILPPSFRETFDYGATYAEPNDLFEAIELLWKDRNAYKAQIERGLSYVERNCSYSRFEDHIMPYISDSDGCKKKVDR